MKIPNFFIIGAPKCGTTAMSRYLREHPNIFISPRKEPMYFDTDLEPAPKMTSRDYLSLFAKADPSIHLAVGEGSTSYLFSKDAVENILAFNPEAKFIVMLRNPVELVQAFHSQMLFIGAEDIPDFERAWKAQADRKKGLQIPDTCVEPKFLYYSDWGMLGLQLERLLARVGRERVKIVVFEDFASNTRLVYDEILDFLRLPSDGRTRFPVINQNKVARWLWLNHFMRSVKARWWRIKQRLGIKRRFWIIRRIDLWNSLPQRRAPIREELRRELAAHYREDVGKISKLLGRDLSSWVSL